MVGTIQIEGGNGEVMAPFGDGSTFFRGRRRDVQIVRLVDDADLPLDVRHALVGITVPIIFTYEQLKEQGVPVDQLELTVGDVLSYIPEVIEALRTHGQTSAAETFESGGHSWFCMCTFSADNYRFMGE